MRIKEARIGRVKAGPDDGLEDGQFIVYPSTFTRTPDSYGDVVAKGAFLDSLESWASKGLTIPGLFGHRMDDPDFYVAWAEETGEDDHGWWVKGRFDLESPKGGQVYRLVKGRRLNELSFAYDVIDEAPVTLEDGTKANELRKVDVLEFSFVPRGANPDTSVVAVKALADVAAAQMKAGRVLSAKNESALRDARDAIDSVLTALGQDEDSKAGADGAGRHAQDTASGTPKAGDEEPPVAKSTDTGNPSAMTLAESLELLVELETT